MKSRIYTGTVMHHRIKPVEHRFVYPHLFFAFDLDELIELDRRFWFFGYNRVSLISVQDRDYIHAGGASIKAKLLESLADKPYAASIDRIVLVTSPRYFNYAFNPVSFFYCCRSDGEIAAIVAEVNNTFGERHRYVLDGGSAAGKVSDYQAVKDFHVSPFNDMAGKYEFRFSGIEKHLSIGVDLRRDGTLIIRTALNGRPAEFTAGNCFGALLQYPLNTLLTIPRICWEAAKLHYLKKLPVYAKPAPVSSATMCTTAPTMVERLWRRLVLKGPGAVPRHKASLEGERQCANEIRPDLPA